MRTPSHSHNGTLPARLVIADDYSYARAAARIIQLDLQFEEGAIEPGGEGQQRGIYLLTRPRQLVSDGVQQATRTATATPRSFSGAAASLRATRETQASWATGSPSRCAEVFAAFLRKVSVSTWCWA